MIKIQIPASTANMGPGFDVLGMALNLYNFIEIEPCNNGIFIEYSDKIIPIKNVNDNFITKSMNEVFKIAKKPMNNLLIKCTNNIPFSRGLGSSSAAIVGGVYSANCLLDYPLSLNEMLKLACKIEGHPDNTSPTLLGGVVISILDKNNLITHKIKPLKGLKYIVIIPDFKLETKLAREIIPQNVSIKDTIFNIGRTALLVSALETNNLDLLKLAMQDRIHQDYRSSLIPGFNNVIKTAIENGAICAALSGSGPSIIAYATENFEKIINSMILEFEKCGVSAISLILESDIEGCKKI